MRLNLAPRNNREPARRSVGCATRPRPVAVGETEVAGLERPIVEHGKRGNERTLPLLNHGPPRPEQPTDEADHANTTDKAIGKMPTSLQQRVCLCSGG